MARRGRHRTWVVIEHQDGTFEVVRSGRPLAHGLSERAVQRMLKNKARPSDAFRRQEPDGYQRPAELSDFSQDRRKV